MTKVSDKILWRQLKDGKKSALSAIYNAQFESLYNYGLKFTLDHTAIEDSIQELFIYLWDHREGLSETDTILPYLLVSMRRRLLRSTTKQRRISGIENTLRYFEAELIEEAGPNDSDYNSRLEKVKKAMSALTSRQQEVLYLRYQLGYDFKEISELLDVNYQSARNLASRALSKLRDVLLVFFLFWFI